MLHHRFVAVVVTVLVFASIGLASGASEHTDAPVALIQAASQDIAANEHALSQATEHGHIKVAGRAEGSTFLYAWPEGLALLRARGITCREVVDHIGRSEIYLVAKTEGLEPSAIEGFAEIVAEGEVYYLVKVEPVKAFGVHMLPQKQRFPLPSEPGLPLHVSAAPVLGRPAAALSYSPMIQAMVDSVSQSRLYSLLSDLSGENAVTIGGETYTIDTRYSPTVMCRRAGEFLREQFEAMGLDTEFDYFGFRTLMKSVIFPFNALEGWSVGKRMTVIHTEDGGDTWTEEHWGDEGALNDIFMWSRTHGCVVGNSGIVLVTGDGRTWQKMAPPTSNDLNAVVFLDSATAYCCGSAGTILRSVNGGQSWASVSSGTSRDLYGICFVDATTGWAVGTSGKILKTQNGGTSWSSVSSPVGVDLLDVTFKGLDDGWICGHSGAILLTTDGASWQEISTPVSSDLHGLFFLNATVGWACGSEGAIIKTVSGGLSWGDVSLEVLPDLKDICFVSASEGWISGNGVLCQSVNGGLAWEDRKGGVQSGDVNVVATIPGAVRPEEIYIMCGHYDCISQIPNDYAPGADDNGTGTVAALEAARVLKGYDFESTLKFVCFSREEQGLIGSAAYVREAYERGDLILGALNFDMIGYEDSHPEDVDILYNGISGWLADQYVDAAGLYVPDLDVVKKFTASVGSDNTSFWDYGYPGFCGIEDSPLNNPQYHRTSDRVYTIDFDFYTDVVRAAVASLAQIAVIDTVTSGIAGPLEAGRIKVGPNPGRGEITIEMSGFAPQAEHFEIYDVAGRLVTRIQAREAGGSVRATWKGIDSSGRSVGPGIYFLKTTEQVQPMKIVLLR
jgi:photosystem II stability/assembly factor-like uncharacterized protein